MQHNIFHYPSIMAASSSNPYTAFEDDADELNDAEQHHLFDDGDLDCLNFFFEEKENSGGGGEYHNQENRTLESKCSSDIMDLLFGESAFETIQEDDVRFPIKSAHHEQPHKRQIRWFDQSNLQQLHLHQDQTSSLGDLRIDSFPDRKSSTTSNHLSSHEMQAQCPKTLQLQKLAESMKRTEESRRHVMMHRSMLTEEQQQAIHLTKEQLARQNERTFRIFLWITLHLDQWIRAKSQAVEYTWSK